MYSRPLKDLGFALAGYTILATSKDGNDEWVKFCNIIAQNNSLKEQVRPHYEALSKLLWELVEKKRENNATSRIT